MEQIPSRYVMKNIFSVPLLDTLVSQDTDELKTCDLYTYSENTKKEVVDSMESVRVLDKFPKTKNILLSYFYGIVKSQLKYDGDFDITTSWITKTSKNESAQMHNHKNSFFSGVYYFDEYDENCGGITFENPLNQLSSYLVTTSDLNDNTIQYSSDSGMSIIPQSKLLLFFPSYMSHKIENHNSDKIRYSLAFNIVPVGLYGRSDSSYHTYWLN